MGIVIAEDEIEERFVRSSGPGGQNVNKVATSVRLRFDVRSSRSLPDDVRERLIRIAGAGDPRGGPGDRGGKVPHAGAQPPGCEGAAGAPGGKGGAARKAAALDAPPGGCGAAAARGEAPQKPGQAGAPAGFPAGLTPVAAAGV